MVRDLDQVAMHIHHGDFEIGEAFANVTSRGHNLRSTQYALVCYSETPLKLDINGQAFDPSLCRTALGKVPGSSMVTALVWGDLIAPGHIGAQ